MKTLTAALVTTAVFAGPALACSYNKTANAKMSTHTASIITTEKTDEAMSTFDPAIKPVFEAEKKPSEPVKKEDDQE